MIIKTIIEGHPIWVAIDRGGGQTCDVKGVIEELDKAGYYIIPKSSMPFPEIKMEAKYKN